MTEREVLKLALEALEGLFGIPDYWTSEGGGGVAVWRMGGSDAPRQAITAIKEALAQPEQEPVAIKWTLDGDKTCGYNNWLGKTPFGRILITWKGWKKYHDACVDEFPGDFHAYGLPDEVKELCEAEFAKRIGYTTSPQRKPLTDDQIFECENAVPDAVVTDRDWCLHFARAIEAAHGIKE